MNDQMAFVESMVADKTAITKAYRSVADATVEQMMMAAEEDFRWEMRRLGPFDDGDTARRLVAETLDQVFEAAREKMRDRFNLWYAEGRETGP